MSQSARDLAKAIYAWADKNGYLVGYDTVPWAERVRLQQAVPELEDDTEADQLIERVQVTSIAFSESQQTVTVLTDGHLGPRNSKVLPTHSKDGLVIEWIGSAHIQHSPPPLPSQPPSSKHCYLHKNRIACGSSVTAAVTWGAGSLGCLVKDKDGELCGLTNNHVTGGCNHMAVGMPVLTPAPIDASPSGPEPRTIGRHKALIQLQSGNPQAVSTQDFDAAIFRISDPDMVTSMQGQGDYDTPSKFGSIDNHIKVKKLGRTTELTHGKVLGPVLTPIPMPYRSVHFNATVYLSNMVLVAGEDDKPFSDGGDSGSLVVSDDGSQALGLVVGTMGGASILMPLAPLLKNMSVDLIHSHNV